MKALEGEGTGVGYNSAVVVSPSGEVVGNYRKSFRFETDKNWAREGELIGMRGWGKADDR
jgi:protein N-terminal amidase